MYNYFKKSKIIFLFILAFTLNNNCGFSPIYADKSDVPEVKIALKNIYVAPIEDEGETGLRKKLYIAFGKQGKNDAEFQLVVSLKETLYSVILKSDGTVDRYDYSIQVNYDLIDNKTNSIIDSNMVRSISAYDVETSDFETAQAKKKAIQLTSNEITNSIKRQLSVSLYSYLLTSN